MFFSRKKHRIKKTFFSQPYPWHSTSADLFTYDGDNYLIIADYFSKYPIIEKLGSDTSSNAIAKLTLKTLSIFGVPQRVISDNGPQFQGSAYQKLMQDYGIEHITSSPWHPQSHGFIERMIRTTKNLIRKSPEDFYKAVLSYRTTPLGPQMPSPAELMFGRKLPTSLPVHVRGPHNDPFRQKREEVLQKSANHYNTNSQELSDLNMNQPIFYQDVARKTWSPGVVFGCGPEPRSYTVKCSTTGRLLRRNRILLRP